MAFCPKCGKELAEGAQFCANCGTPVNGAVGNDGSKRVQKFVGEIRKCPNCGTVLESFQARCPSCGFELNEDTSSKSKELISFIENYKNAYDVEDKINLVSSFPVPNTKVDLYEFAMLAGSEASSVQTSISNDFSLTGLMQGYLSVCTF